MMKRFAPLAALCLLAAPAAAEPAMWRLTDADTEMILFGSVHVLPEDADWRGEAVMAAFEGADLIVFETALDDEAQRAAARLAERHSALEGGERLPDILSNRDGEDVAEAARAVGITPSALDYMRPWMASLVLSLRFAQQAGQNPDDGVDRVLAALAEAEGKETAFLESAEDQIQIFAGLSRQAEIDMLASTAREIVETPDVLGEMDRAWLDGDIAALADLALDPMRRDAPELYDAALKRRNTSWTETLDAMMDSHEGVILVVVGAAHLAGRDSLVDLLEARGHSVVRAR